MEKQKNCPEFPFFGANYPDACCIGGILFDLDNCDEQGNLYFTEEEYPCPFCRTEKFIDQDPFGWVDTCYYEMSATIPNNLREIKAREQADKKYRLYLQNLKQTYGGDSNHK